MTKLDQYQEIVKTLQNNDRNATYDEILEDNDNDLEMAIIELTEVLMRLVYEEGLKGEELEFYKEQLNKVNNIK